MRALPLLALAAALLAPSVTHAQSLKPDEIYSSIEVRVISEPNPVLGADGKMHLAYELMVTNPSRLFMTLDKVEAVDPTGRGLGSMEGDALAAMTTLFAGTGRTLPPGGTAAVFLDVTFGATEQLPPTVLARITTTRQAAGSDGKPIPLPADAPVPATITFTGASTAIGRPAVVVEPPLRGPGWVAVNGCCDAVTSHRGAIMTVNGRVHVPERFAIDWLQLDSAGRVYTGDVASLSSYPYFGTPIHSVAEGVVVNLYNGTDEQVPGSDAKGITTESIGGNMLVIDIGNDNYAFYAHMQRDSLTVKLGDRVASGQVLGLLGNTGNSTAPHLHFHVMDGPSPLDANGLPYVFTRFSSRGVAQMDGDNDPMEKGDPARIDGSRLAGPHVDELPLNNQVVDFD